MSSGSQRLAALDIQESASDLPTDPGITRLRRAAGQVQAAAGGVAAKWQALGDVSMGGLRGQTSSPNPAPSASIQVDPIYADGSDETAKVQAWINSAVNGTEIQWPPGTIRLTAQIIATNRKGIMTYGRGRNATLFDVPAALASSAFLWDHCYGIGGGRFGFTSSSYRTAGACIEVRGGHQDYKEDLATFSNARFAEIDFTKQFTGFAITDNDTPGTGGAWDVQFARSFFYDGTQDGVPFLLDSRNGGIHLLSDVYVGAASSSGNKPLCGLHLKATNDFTITRFSETLCQTGLLIDPAAASLVVRAGTFSKCYFDTNSVYSIRIAPTSGGVVDTLDFQGCWMASAPNVVSLEGSGVSFVSFSGGKIINTTTGWGFTANAVSSVAVNGTKVGGVSGTGGVLVTGSAASCQFTGMLLGNHRGLGKPAKGFQIDAGCTDIQLVGNNAKDTTTPLSNAGTGTVNSGNVGF